MIICSKCGKRKGLWWDHYCDICRRAPVSGEKALEYEKTYGDKDILTPEQIKSVVNTKTSEKYNKLAIISSVFSLIAVLGMGLFGIAGFILGIISLTQIKYTKERGKGLAITAIIVGFIWSFVTGILRRLIEAGF